MRTTKKSKGTSEKERDIWQESLDAIRDIKRGHVGARRKVAIPPVLEARQKVGMAQAKFAELLGVSLRTLQEWEQGRRQPTRAAQSLIRIANERPKVLHQIFGKAA